MYVHLQGLDGIFSLGEVSLSLGLLNGLLVLLQTHVLYKNDIHSTMYYEVSVPARQSVCV